MSKKKVTLAKAPTQGAIPLSDISISWKSRAWFDGQEDQEITLSGKELALFVAWVAKTPWRLNGAVNLISDLSGLAEVLRGLSAANLVDANVDCNATFDLLSDVTEDFVARLRAVHDVEEEMGKEYRPVVTIGKPAEKAVA